LSPPFSLNVFAIKSVVGNLTTQVGVFRGITYILLVDMSSCSW
jgi:hypothetical protein